MNVRIRGRFLRERTYPRTTVEMFRASRVFILRLWELHRRDDSAICHPRLVEPRSRIARKSANVLLLVHTVSIQVSSNAAIL